MSAPIAPPNPKDSSLIIVSGMYGSGKSIALHTFEDLDYYCVDNLPAELLPEFVRGATGKGSGSGADMPPKLAVSIDVRNRNLAAVTRADEPPPHTLSDLLQVFSRRAQAQLDRLCS